MRDMLGKPSPSLQASWDSEPPLHLSRGSALHEQPGAKRSGGGSSDGGTGSLASRVRWFGVADGLRVSAGVPARLFLLVFTAELHILVVGLNQSREGLWYMREAEGGPEEAWSQSHY